MEKGSSESALLHENSGWLFVYANLTGSFEFSEASFMVSISGLFFNLHGSTVLFAPLRLPRHFARHDFD